MAFVLSHAQDSHKAPRVVAGTLFPTDSERNGACSVPLLSSTPGGLPSNKSKTVYATYEIYNTCSAVIITAYSDITSQPYRYTGVRLSLEGLI